MTQRLRTLAPLATGAYAIALAAVSLAPSGGEGTLGGWDRSISPTAQNALHVPAYAVLQALAMIWAAGAGRLTLAAMLWSALASCAFGALMEVGQAYIPGRSGSVVDIALNALGVATAVLWAAVAQLARISRAGRARTDRFRGRVDEPKTS